MKKTLIIVFLMVTSLSFSQNKFIPKMGKALFTELDMVRYEKDTTAKALVLEEKAHTYMSEKNNLDFRTDYYHRIKLFDKEEFDRATISISLYDGIRAVEIEAYSYNSDNGNIVKTALDRKTIYTKDIDEKWREVVFTIPNIKEGSVIEYKYSLISKYSTVRNWYFQSDIPKVRSDYRLTYLGNYKYNVRLIGYLPFDREDSKVKNECIRVPGIGYGSCGILTYGIDAIPAFKEEKYMLSEENYISHLVFDLISFTSPRGGTTKYTKTWKDADRSFKKNYLDGQVNKKSFFKKNLPQELLAVEDEMTRAKGIFTHIQDHFTWDERYWSYNKTRVKNAYEERSGDVYDINLSLYNSLQAANIESYIVMVATRNRAVPTKLFPVTKDFNYILVKAVVGGKSYFMDATDKFLTFGQVPLRAVNGEGRVLDFDKGSYWEEVKSDLKNYTKIWAKLKLNEEGELEGDVSAVQKGYYASNAREDLFEEGEDEYLRNLELKFSGYEIEDYVTEDKTALDKPFTEKFTLTPEESILGSKTIRFNPFFYYRITKNPFTLNERNFPVDFGYTQSINYTMSMEIPEGYKVTSLPEKMAVAMPNRSAFISFLSQSDNGVIKLNYRYQIKRKIFSSEEYFYLKEFYKKVTKLFGSQIVLEKI